MKKFLLAVTAAVVAIGIAVPVASSATASNGTAPLMHYGPNPGGLVVPALDPGTPANGVVNVHYNKNQDRFKVNLSVNDALPNTTYVLDIRYWAFGPQSELGTLTTNSQGTATAQFEVSNITPTPAFSNFYIDISVKNGPGDYGDTFIAGPFTLG